MDASISRSEIPPRKDPHEWNSYDHYRTIHEIRLAEHPFVDHDTPNTIVFDDTEEEDVITQRGVVYCRRGVVLEVEKVMEVRYSNGQRRVRTMSFRYAAWVRGGNPVLRYHNIHRGDRQYHHRVFDPVTGGEVFYEPLERYQFPIFTEVLDELEIVTRSL